MTALDTDTLFDLVAHHRRRHLIDCLREHRAMTMRDLAEAVAVREYERPLEEISPKGLKGVYLTIYHAHIPKLERANVIGYVRERDAVVPGDAFEEAVELVVAAREERKRAA